MAEPQRVGHRKFLGLALCHPQDLPGLEVDADGWVGIDKLLEALESHGRKISKKRLMAIAASNEDRFEVANGRIRARPGAEGGEDSQSGAGGLVPSEPPEHLYHGTADQFLASIREGGIDRRGRSHVPLTADPAAAKEWGRHHGRAIVLRVHAGRMHAAGHEFFAQADGVWLTSGVPVEHFERYRIE